MHSGRLPTVSRRARMRNYANKTVMIFRSRSSRMTGSPCMVSRTGTRAGSAVIAASSCSQAAATV